MVRADMAQSIADYALKCARSEYVTESTFAKPGDLPNFISLPLSWRPLDQDFWNLMAGNFALGYVWLSNGQWCWLTNWLQRNKSGYSCATLTEAQNLLVAAVLD